MAAGILHTHLLICNNEAGNHALVQGEFVNKRLHLVDSALSMGNFCKVSISNTSRNVLQIVLFN